MLSDEKLAAVYVCTDDMCNRRGIEVFRMDEESLHCKECGGELLQILVDPDEEVDDVDSLLTLRAQYQREEAKGYFQVSGFKASDEKVNGKKPNNYDGGTRRAPMPSEVLSKQVNGGTTSYTPSVVKKSSDTFTCPADLSTCPVAEKAQVEIPIELYRQWVYLANRFKTEWIAYLIGSETSPNKYKIDDFYFPKQTVTPAHCEADDGEILPGTIGSVHSHVGMQAFFSAEDVSHFNHPVEIVLNNKGDILCNGRTKLECGRWHRGLSEIQFSGLNAESELEVELKAKMTERRDWSNTSTVRTEPQSHVQAMLPHVHSSGSRSWGD